MRNLVYIALFAVAAFVGFQQYSAYEERKERERIAAEKAAEEAAEEAARRETTARNKDSAPTTGDKALTKRKITCKACDGVGRVTVTKSGGQQKLGACPVCGFLGYRNIMMPAHSKVCKTCHGMGRLRQHSAKGQLGANRCTPCSGTGFIVTRTHP